jgi:hypothetical protein
LSMSADTGRRSERDIQNDNIKNDTGCGRIRLQPLYPRA